MLLTTAPSLFHPNSSVCFWSNLLLTVGQGSEDEYEVPPCSAQGSSAGHSAPRSPLPPDTGHGAAEFESGSSVDSVAAEPGASMETVVLESDQAGKMKDISNSSMRYHKDLLTHADDHSLIFWLNQHQSLI